MKKIFALLLLMPFFFACSSDDDKEGDGNKTSFSIRSECGTITDISILYKENDNYIKIADLAGITFGFEKYISVDYNKVKEIYIEHIFKDNYYMVDTTFTLKKGIDNKFTIQKGTKLYIEID